MSPGEYLTRLRLRRFVDEMRKPGAMLADLRNTSVNTSYHNLLEAFRGRTGFRPSHVQRALSDNDVRELVDVKLSLLDSAVDSCKSEAERRSTRYGSDRRRFSPVH